MISDPNGLVDKDTPHPDVDTACRRQAPAPRATRYPIPATVYYRTPGEKGWCEGTALNISRTGILFHSEPGLAPQSVLDMRILLPVDEAEDSLVSVSCRAKVLRIEADGQPEGKATAAAALSRCRIHRLSPGPSLIKNAADQES